MTILRIILFFLLAPVFAILAQAAGTFQDEFCIVDTDSRTESLVLDNTDTEICNYDSSGALLHQRKSIDDEDNLNQSGELEASTPKWPLFSFLAEFVATNKIDDFVDLTRHRKDHILNRRASGAGKAGKTEFPSSWSNDRILHQVSDIATDPNATRGVGKWNSPYAIGTRDGVDIRVDFYPSNHAKYPGQISTAYPINATPNP